MNINPKCDVETFSDFQKYYQKAYLPTLDGRVLYFQSTIDADQEVILVREFPSENEGNPYRATNWKALSDKLIYSRVNGKIGVVNGKLLLSIVPRNKTTARGFRHDQQNWYWHTPNTDRNTNGWMHIDWPHLHGTYGRQPYPDFILSKPNPRWYSGFNVDHEGTLIDERYSIGKVADGWNLYYLLTHIGTFDPANGVRLLPKYAHLGPVLSNKHSFKGVHVR